MPDISRRRRLFILAICCLSLLIVGMDNTIVNVAVNAIRLDLHASLSDLQWTIDAYTLVLASLLILSGSTTDRVGRRAHLPTRSRRPDVVGQLLVVTTLATLTYAIIEAPVAVGRRFPPSCCWPPLPQPRLRLSATNDAAAIR